MRNAQGKLVATLDDLCQELAPTFRQAGLPAPTGQDVIETLKRDKAERVDRMNKSLRRQETRRHERRFLRDEKGNAYGEVVAEIPTQLYHDLRQQRDFGPAIDSPEGVQELLKAFPACRVKSVDRKYVGVGFRGRKARVNFGPGTLVPG